MLDCHVLKRFGIYMIEILDRRYRSSEELPTDSARMSFTRYNKEMESSFLCKAKTAKCSRVNFKARPNIQTYCFYYVDSQSSCNRSLK